MKCKFTLQESFHKTGYIQLNLNLVNFTPLHFKYKHTSYSISPGILNLLQIFVSEIPASHILLNF